MSSRHIKIENYFENVKEEIENQNSDDSALRMAKTIYPEFIDYTDEKEFDLQKPKEMRQTIADFYEEKSEDYKEIRNQHLNPMKKLLTYIEGEVEAEYKRNIRMVRDSLKPEYFGDKEIRNQADKLDERILTKREKKILRNKTEGEKKFAVELFLQTSAKIGALSSVQKREVLKEEKIVKLRRQYKQEGEKPLPEHRERDVSVDEGLITLYSDMVEPKDREYLFGETAKNSHSRLRKIVREVNQEVSFKVTSRILRDTSGYYKMESNSTVGVREDMGLKTDMKVRRFQKVREMRENR